MRINRSDIEQKALRIRQEHNILTYGVKDIFSLIAQREIDLIRYPFGKDKLLGFCAVYEGKKVIVSNSSEILSREIFTVAHELGHVEFDLGNVGSDVRVDLTDLSTSESYSEQRAFLFANCLLMPEDMIRKFVRYELRKNSQKLGPLDIVRMQMEFSVSYAAMAIRLSDLDLIDVQHKSWLFEERNNRTSRALFEQLDADQRLLKPTNKIIVPARYLDYVLSNYEEDYIPYSSLAKALSLVGVEPEMFKKEEPNEEINVDDIFKEYGE